MSADRSALPHQAERVFLTYTGMETDLIFTQGVDLPGFASYPLLRTDVGRAQLRSYYDDLIAVGAENGLGVILEGATWVANRDRAAELGDTPDELVALNIASVVLMDEARAAQSHQPVILSANVGPRTDAYYAATGMTISDAMFYHADQISVLAQTNVDLISGYTLANWPEAAGMALAARAYGLPIVIAFTVEQDGCLPTGQSLAEAIQSVDAATESYPCYYMINCAHPDHFAAVLTDATWMRRLKGVVANASRCSHAELDHAEVLDDGDPQELGQSLAALRKSFPNLIVFGGCCGTDMRHMRQIGAALNGG